MPVKNKNRQSNSGYEGVITGLNDEEKKVLEDAGISGGGIPTVSINTQTFQLDTSSLTNKDSYVIASMDDGEGYISYMALQTYFSSDGYFNKEVKMQTTSHDFRLSLANVSFRSSNNYTLRGETTNIDFTNTLDSTNTWTKLGDIKYIAIEENEMMSGESSHKYLEINSLPTLPSDASTKNLTLNSVNGTLTWNTIGNGLEIKDGALQATGSGFNIFDNAFSIGVAENINEETLTLTEVGLNKINNMFANGKLLGLCFEDPANITTDFTFIPFVSFTDGNYLFTGTTYIAGTNLKFTQIKINKTTGAIEIVQKLVAATDA